MRYVLQFQECSVFTIKGSPVMASIVPGLVSPLAVEVSHVWADGAELSQNTASHTSEDTGGAQ